MSEITERLLMKQIARRRKRALRALATAISLFAVLALVVIIQLSDRGKVPAETIQNNIESLELHTTEIPVLEETIHPALSEDTILLAKIMQEEDGVNWSDAMIMCIGEVVLNRVASPEYPDTVRDVLYQVDGGFIQYAPVQTSAWESIEPEERYIDLAERLFAGERVMNDPCIVYQALFEQGDETILSYKDTALGTTTYFCKR